MAHQTTIKNGTNGAVNEMLEGIGGLGNSLISLASLQARLAVEDCRESGRRSIPALVALAIFVPLAIASTTIGLYGIAAWFNENRVLSLSQALLLVALGGLITSGLLAYFFSRKMTTSMRAFIRSREELERNIAWLGTILSQSGR